MKAWIQLRSGRAFYPADPDPALITIEDVAFALSNLCRFGGHVEFYSVAEHSVRVAALVAAQDTALTLAALLHDASEGLGLVDVPKPVKVLLPDYDRLEAGVMRAVEVAFGLAPQACDHPLIKQADMMMLETERRLLHCAPPQPWGTEHLNYVGQEELSVQTGVAPRLGVSSRAARWAFLDAAVRYGSRRALTSCA